MTFEHDEDSGQPFILPPDPGQILPPGGSVLYAAPTRPRRWWRQSADRFLSRWHLRRWDQIGWTEEGSDDAALSALAEVLGLFRDATEVSGGDYPMYEITVSRAQLSAWRTVAAEEPGHDEPGHRCTWACPAADPAGDVRLMCKAISLGITPADLAAMDREQDPMSALAEWVACHV